MPRATYSVTIARLPQEVFELLADGEKCTQWRPGVLDIRRESGDGVGTRYSQGVKGPMGRRIAADYVVTMFEPGRRYDLEPADGGTRLTFSLDAELGGLRGLLMGSQVQRTMDAEVRALDNLKRVLEGGSGASA
jgi:carbon monoxide dehydrogenase subunit G